MLARRSRAETSQSRGTYGSAFASPRAASAASAERSILVRRPKGCHKAIAHHFFAQVGALTRTLCGHRSGGRGAQRNAKLSMQSTPRRAAPRCVRPQPCRGMKADCLLCAQEYWPGARSTFAKQSGVRRCATSKAIGISSANARVSSPSVHVSTAGCHTHTQTCLRKGAGVSE